MKPPEVLRSFRVQLAVAGFAAIYLAVLALFTVTYLTRDEYEDTVGGAEVTTTQSNSALDWSVVAVVALLPIAAAIAWWLAGRATRPIEKIRQVAEHVDASDIDVRIGLRTGPHELQTLAASFDAMLDRLRDAAAVRRQRIDELSHELRTPLAVLIANADIRLARVDEPVASLRDGLEQSRRTAERMQAVLESMLLAERGQAHALERQAIDLRDVVRRAAAEMEVVAQARQVTISAEASVEVLGNWDGQMLERAVVNLLDNAVRLSPVGGNVQVAVRRADAVASVSVSDHGPGVPEKDQEAVFEWAWRADAEEGHPTHGGRRGLGLAISRQIAQAHGGDLTLRSPDPAGYSTTFLFSLPLGA